MTAGHVRAGLITLVLVGMGSRAFALEADKWSLVQNKGTRTLTVQQAKLPEPVGKNFPTFGKLYIRKAGESGDGRLIDQDTPYLLEPNTDYQFYFMTTDYTSLCTQVFKMGEQTVVVAKSPGGIGRDMVLVGARCEGSSQKSPLVFNVSGFRNTQGGPFITIRDTTLKAPR